MRNIFIVEDNQDIGFVLDYFLQDEGFSVSLFPSVAEFQSTYREELPDIFLLDIMLPDGNGLELCKEIKDNSRSAHLPVLVMSAHSAGEAMSADTCADGFIKKPFDLNEVLQEINKCLIEVP